MWYVMQACAALDVSIEDVVAGNVEKLKKRYLVETLMYTIQRIEQQTIDNKENLKFIIYYNSYGL